jgi:lipoate-protein ligase A
MSRGRLIIDPPAAGVSNMAIDQALLETANEKGNLTVRFYSWQEPTLSLGYFQDYQHRDQHWQSAECPVVRRSTGGGAIVHDREITYSICIPSENRWSADHEQLYWKVHQMIVDLLEAMGFPASLFEPAHSHYPPDYDASAFLCFQRRTPGDVTLAGYKIAGSAQRRKQNAILQHGSLILARSAAAPELPGISDLVDHLSPESHNLLFDEILRQLETRMAKLFSEKLELGSLTESELEAAQRWSEIHQAESWLLKR